MNTDALVIRLSGAEARCHIDDGDMLVLDVRSAEEFEEGALPGAMNLPWPKLKPAKVLERETPILLYCDNGAKSRKAAEVLLALGFTQVYTMGAMAKYYQVAS
ncbi:MAG: rhodanese-like domain-containing protein [Gammaproteobacteria bacterium]|nr:rhodanese-like domain-containing protein [Gammaproteobacteria bacterium]